MKQGLTTTQAQQKLSLVGFNQIEQQKSFSAPTLFLAQFPTVINGILLLAAIFSFLIQSYLDGFFILLIILVNGFFGFIQEYNAEKSLEKLQTYTTPNARVIRDGQEIQISTLHLVPGDVVVLSEGDRIPADGKLIKTTHIELDESILTGESLSAEKTSGDTVYLGTLITKGKGEMRIEKTGAQTRFGKIAYSLATIRTDPTPLQKNLSTLGKQLSFIVIIITIILVGLGALQKKELVPTMLLAISIGVAAIPEGLPAVITIALAIGTNRMAKRNAIVRKMPAIETLGTIQVLLVDKTGTLTQNVMQVKKHWFINQQDLPKIVNACLLGNTASITKNEQTNSYTVSGDRTDAALLLFAKQEKERLRESFQQATLIEEFVFNPKTKMIASIANLGEKQYLFARGAPESVIAASTLSEEEKKRTLSVFHDYASEELRVIALGYKTYEGKSKTSWEHDLQFLGLIGIYDPPRSEAKSAIQAAKHAGIHIVMVTGDNELTALSIAKDIGLLEQDEEVITGDKLAQISDYALASIITKTHVFARIEPQDKLRLVEILKTQGFVVGVTGDGVNDALALKKADVGIAMGETGTDVAKEASDIVLTNDDFSTLIKAIEEGRKIYINIVNAILYLLTGNLFELALVTFAILLGLPTPLLPTQILWINLVTDGLPALALARSKYTNSQLTEKPRKTNEPLLTMRRVALIGTLGITAALILLIVFQQLLPLYHIAFVRTIILNLLVIMQLLLVFFIRKNNLFHVDRFLFLSILATIILQILISTVPFLQNIFHLSLTP